MRRIKFVLCLYTDDDWSFESKDGQVDYKRFTQWPGCLYCFAFEPWGEDLWINTCTEEYAEKFVPTKEKPYTSLTLFEFLEQLKKDLTYSSHEWIRQDFDEMIDAAIEFLKVPKAGVFHKGLIDGNWQPSSLFITVEDFE